MVLPFNLCTDLYLVILLSLLNINLGLGLLPALFSFFFFFLLPIDVSEFMWQKLSSRNLISGNFTPFWSQE